MSAPVPGTALPIYVCSDVVALQCFIGKRRLEKAIALKPEIAVKVYYQPYIVYPWVPRKGMSRAEFLTRGFGSFEKRHRKDEEEVVAAARAEGLLCNVDAITRQPNTLDCNRLIRWAGESGNQAQMKQRLMELFFTEGADLSDNEVLLAAARDCAMDTKLIRRRLESEEDIAEVSADAEACRDSGIDGVPCFILGGVYAISGAQAPEVLADAIARAAAAAGGHDLSLGARPRTRLRLVSYTP